jgi:hypothetical protein
VKRVTRRIAKRGRASPSAPPWLQHAALLRMPADAHTHTLLDHQIYALELELAPLLWHPEQQTAAPVRSLIGVRAQLCWKSEARARALAKLAPLHRDVHLKFARPWDKLLTQMGKDLPRYALCIECYRVDHPLAGGRSSSRGGRRSASSRSGSECGVVECTRPITCLATETTGGEVRTRTVHKHTESGEEEDTGEGVSHTDQPAEREEAHAAKQGELQGAAREVEGDAQDAATRTRTPTHEENPPQQERNDSTPKQQRRTVIYTPPTPLEGEVRTHTRLRAVRQLLTSLSAALDQEDGTPRERTSMYARAADTHISASTTNALTNTSATPTHTGSSSTTNASTATTESSRRLVEEADRFFAEPGDLSFCEHFLERQLGGSASRAVRLLRMATQGHFADVITALQEEVAGSSPDALVSNVEHRIVIELGRDALRLQHRRTEAADWGSFQWTLTSTVDCAAEYLREVAIELHEVNIEEGHETKETALRHIFQVNT